VKIRVVLLAIIAVLALPAVEAQTNTTPSAADLQNDSVRRQMEAITSAAAIQQAESIKRQSEAIRTQYGNSARCFARRRACGIGT
jgi:hypothetical protein